MIHLEIKLLLKENMHTHTQLKQSTHRNGCVWCRVCSDRVEAVVDALQSDRKQRKQHSTAAGSQTGNLSHSVCALRVRDVMYTRLNDTLDTHECEITLVSDDLRTITMIMKVFFVLFLAATET